MDKAWNGLDRHHTGQISPLLKGRELLSYVWMNIILKKGYPPNWTRFHDLCKDLGEEGRLIEATAPHLHRFRDRIESEGKLQECGGICSPRRKLFFARYRPGQPMGN